MKLKKLLWRSLPFKIRKNILLKWFIGIGEFNIPNNKKIRAYHIIEVVSDLEKGNIHKRTGYSKEGVYEHAFTLAYLNYAEEVDFIIDIGSGPGVQLKSILELLSDQKKKYFHANNSILCFEPSLKYSDIFKLNLGKNPIRNFVTSFRDQKTSIYQILNNIKLKKGLIKIDIEGFEFEILHELISDPDIYNDLFILCEFHVKKILKRKKDPFYLLTIINEIAKDLLINYHHDALKMECAEDLKWRKLTSVKDIELLDTIAIKFRL